MDLLRAAAELYGACLLDNNELLIGTSTDARPPTEDEMAAIKAKAVEIDSMYAATQYRRDRAKEYPDFREYLDGVVKDDKAQIQRYIDECLAIKEKYTK